MNATDSQSGSCPEFADPLEILGRLLRGHTWRDSRDWARALDQLSRLSEEDLRQLINASSEPQPMMVARAPAGGR